MPCIIISQPDYNRLEKEYEMECPFAISSSDIIFAKHTFKNIAPGYVYLSKAKNIEEIKHDLEMELGQTEWFSKALVSAESYDVVRRQDITNIIKKIYNYTSLSKKTQDHKSKYGY